MAVPKFELPDIPDNLNGVQEEAFIAAPELELPSEEERAVKEDIVTNVPTPPSQKKEQEKTGKQQPIKILIKRKSPSSVPIPSKPSIGASCYDLYADLTGTVFGNTIYIPTGQSRLVPTNLFFEVPPGYELQVRPKTGYIDDGLVIQYTPYTVDPEFREELKILITNTSNTPKSIAHGQKIAQFAIAPILNSLVLEQQ
jgi:dUTP pyrophosphatase